MWEASHYPRTTDSLVGDDVKVAVRIFEIDPQWHGFVLPCHSTVAMPMVVSSQSDMGNGLSNPLLPEQLVEKKSETRFSHLCAVCAMQWEC